MCRSIKRLRNPDQPATPEEIQCGGAAVRQEDQRLPEPSKANQESFERAVFEVAE
jgi:hypothetical protein